MAKAVKFGAKSKPKSGSTGFNFGANTVKKSKGKSRGGSGGGS